MRHRFAVVAAFAAVIALAVVVGVGSAAVTVSQSGWSWGNPTPQGNTLHTIDFVQGRGYATGDGGTALRTDDGGATWTGLATGTSAQLYGLQVIDPETLVVLGGNGGCVLRRSDDGGTTFHKIFNVTEQGCTSPLDGFTFVDPQTGYLMGHDGNIFRTTDAGQSFARQTAIPGTQASNNNTGNQVEDIWFTTPDNGIAFVQPQGNAPTIAFATTDAGISWKPVDAVDPGVVRKVWFLDSQHGFATGPSTLLTTSDGGKTWKAQPAAAPYDLSSIRCVDPQTCILTTTKNDKLLRTTDGGKTFTEITASSQALAAAAFASTTRVVAVGANGATVLSDDGGVNYTPMSHDIGGTYTDLRPGPNAASALALGDKGGLAMTVDGGASWKTLAVPTSAAITDAAFPSADTQYALDGKGGLFKSANGGNSWQTLSTGATTPPAALVAPAPDTVVLVGPRGIRRAIGATPFSKVGGKNVAKATLSAATLEPGIITAWDPGTRNLFISTDKGASWKALKLPKKNDTYSAEFLSARLGFVLTDANRLLKTTNGGRRWTELIAGTDDAAALTMGSPTEGFLTLRTFGQPGTAAAGDAFVLRTSDGGRTWRPQEIAGGTASAVVATGPQQAYALVGDDHLFFTSVGGDAGNPTALALRPSVKSFSAKSLKKAKGKVTITGTLAGALGGEQIVVSRRDLAGGHWVRQFATVGANGGSFTTAWKIKRSSVFVAQWAGDSGRRGQGSSPVTVKVLAKKRKPSKR
jgi:photosystem II stability/assembly factor-like uncharacterized protein